MHRTVVAAVLDQATRALEPHPGFRDLVQPPNQAALGRPLPPFEHARQAQVPTRAGEAIDHPSSRPGSSWVLVTCVVGGLAAGRSSPRYGWFGSVRLRFSLARRSHSPWGVLFNYLVQGTSSWEELIDTIVVLERWPCWGNKPSQDQSPCFFVTTHDPAPPFSDHAPRVSRMTRDGGQERRHAELGNRSAPTGDIHTHRLSLLLNQQLLWRLGVHRGPSSQPQNPLYEVRPTC